MITEKWRSRFRKTGRVLVYVAAVVYLLALYDKISSIQSDIDSIQSDMSSLADGTCTNNHLCP
jgi:hypothetical protein